MITFSHFSNFLVNLTRIIPVTIFFEDIICLNFVIYCISFDYKILLLVIIYVTFLINSYYILRIILTILMLALEEIKEIKQSFIAFIKLAPKIVYNDRYNPNMWLLIIYMLYTCIIFIFSCINIVYLCFDDYIFLATDDTNLGNTESLGGNSGSGGSGGPPGSPGSPGGEGPGGGPRGNHPAIEITYRTQAQVINDDQGTHGLLNRLTIQMRENRIFGVHGRDVYTPKSYWENEDAALGERHRSLLRTLLYDNPNYTLVGRWVYPADRPYFPIEASAQLKQDILTALARHG